MQRIVLAALILLGSLSTASAVLIDTSGTNTYQTVEPTITDIPNWTSGWGSSGVTGWDYVGQVSGSSAIYLGNGWVITAGHVLPATTDPSTITSLTFDLSGTSYSVVADSLTSISNTYGTADLTMFQITTDPSLPSLNISPFSPTIGGTLAMLGYGGGHGETWGANTVSGTNVLVPIGSYNSIDFYTDYTGTTNKAQVTGGDSGGGDFTYNSFTHKWQLAGLNEAVSTDGMGTITGTSYFIQLSAYRTQIDGIEAVPEPKQWILLVLGLLALVGAHRIKTYFQNRRTSL